MRYPSLQHINAHAFELDKTANTASNYGAFGNRIMYGDIGETVPPWESYRENEKQYANALNAADPAEIERVHNQIRQKYNAAMQHIGLPQSKYAASESWILWDVGKQLHHHNTNGAHSTPNYRIANPLTDERLQDEIVARHIGWEKWRDDYEKSSGHSSDMHLKQPPSHQLTAIGKDLLNQHGIEHKIHDDYIPPAHSVNSAGQSSSGASNVKNPWYKNPKVYGVAGAATLVGLGAGYLMNKKQNERQASLTTLGMNKIADDSAIPSVLIGAGLGGAAGGGYGWYGTSKGLDDILASPGEYVNSPHHGELAKKIQSGAMTDAEFQKTKKTYAKAGAKLMGGIGAGVGALGGLGAHLLSGSKRERRASLVSDARFNKIARDGEDSAVPSVLIGAGLGGGIGAIGGALNNKGKYDKWLQTVESMNKNPEFFAAQIPAVQDAARVTNAMPPEVLKELQNKATLKAAGKWGGIGAGVGLSGGLLTYLLSRSNQERRASHELGYRLEKIAREYVEIPYTFNPAKVDPRVLSDMQQSFEAGDTARADELYRQEIYRQNPDFLDYAALGEAPIKPPGTAGYLVGGFGAGGALGAGGRLAYLGTSTPGAAGQAVKGGLFGGALGAAAGLGLHQLAMKPYDQQQERVQQMKLYRQLDSLSRQPSNFETDKVARTMPNTYQQDNPPNLLATMSGAVLAGAGIGAGTSALVNKAKVDDTMKGINLLEPLNKTDKRVVRNLTYDPALKKYVQTGVSMTPLAAAAIREKEIAAGLARRLPVGLAFGAALGTLGGVSSYGLRNADYVLEQREKERQQQLLNQMYLRSMQNEGSAM